MGHGYSPLLAACSEARPGAIQEKMAFHLLDLGACAYRVYSETGRTLFVFVFYPFFRPLFAPSLSLSFSSFFF
jgi:hypothetical protein